MTGSYVLYRALKDNNVPVQFIGYPGPGHAPGDPVRQRDVNRRWIEGASGGLTMSRHSSSLCATRSSRSCRRNTHTTRSVATLSPVPRAVKSRS